MQSPLYTTAGKAGTGTTMWAETALPSTDHLWLIASREGRAPPWCVNGGARGNSVGWLVERGCRCTALQTEGRSGEGRSHNGEVVAG